MPNGVICGGAVEGSNQLGASVTCHAMATRPDGAGPPAPAKLTPSPTSAASASQTKARDSRMLRRMFSSQERSFADRTFLSTAAQARRPACRFCLWRDATPAAAHAEVRQTALPVGVRETDSISRRTRNLTLY